MEDGTLSYTGAVGAASLSSKRIRKQMGLCRTFARQAGEEKENYTTSVQSSNTGKRSQPTA